MELSKRNQQHHHLQRSNNLYRLSRDKPTLWTNFESNGIEAMSCHEINSKYLSNRNIELNTDQTNNNIYLLDTHLDRSKSSVLYIQRSGPRLHISGGSNTQH